MSIRNRLITTTLVATIALGPTANAQSIEDGRIVAERYCSSCHEIGRMPRYSEMAPSFADVARRPVTTSGGLNRFLSTPHDRMPGYLMRQEILDVAAYIVNLNRK